MIVRTTLICVGLTGLAAAQGCCKCGEEPPPLVATTTGDDEPVGIAPEPEPAPRGVTEARAVELAMNTAMEQGADLDGYDDIVVHSSADGRSWEVQLRRPRILRYYMVTIDKQSGAATLEERSQ